MQRRDWERASQRVLRASIRRLRKPSGAATALLLIVGILAPVLRDADPARAATSVPALDLRYLSAANTTSTKTANNDAMTNAVATSALLNVKVSIPKSGGTTLPTAATTVTLEDSLNGGAFAPIAGKTCTPVAIANNGPDLHCGTGAAATFLSGNEFSLASHGLATGAPFHFMYVNGGSGVARNTPYYAISTGVNTFKVSSGVAVTFTAGTPGTVNLSANGLSNGATVTFPILSASVSGITANTTYYVVNAGTNTFQLSATSGGSAIALSGATMTGTMVAPTAGSTKGGPLTTSISSTDVVNYPPIATLGTTKVTLTGASAGTFSLPGHTYANGTPIQFLYTAPVATGITTAGNYYVVNSDTVAGTFQLATTVGGSAITSFTSSPSGLSSARVMIAGFNVSLAEGYHVLRASWTGGRVPESASAESYTAESSKTLEVPATGSAYISPLTVTAGSSTTTASFNTVSTPILPATDASGGTALRFQATLVKPFLGTAIPDPATISFQYKPSAGSWTDLGSCTAMADAPGTQDNVKCTANATFDTGVSASTFTLANHGFTAAASVKLAKVTGTTGVTAGATYWPVNVTTNTFQLSATQNGAAISLPEAATTGSIDLYRGVDLKVPSADTYQLRARWAGVSPYGAGASRWMQVTAKTNDLAWDTSGSPANSPDTPQATAGATGTGSNFTYLAASAGAPAFTPLTYSVSGFSPATIDASERQQVALTAMTAGYSYSLTWNGTTSTQITQANHNASVTTSGSVRYALDQLLGAGNWTTDLPTTAAGISNFSYRVFFKGSLATTNVGPLSVTTPLTVTGAVTSIDGGLGVATGTHIPMTSAGALQVSGTVPAGTYTATVTATDAVSGAAISKPITITVNAAPVSTLAIPSIELTAGGDADFTPVTVTGGTAPYTFSFDSLPPGLTMPDRSTGAITGSPLYAKGATAYTISVQDKNGVVAASQQVLITVVAGVGIAGKDFLALAPSGSLTSDYTLSGGSSAAWQTAVYADAASSLGTLASALTKAASSTTVTLAATAPATPFYVLVDAEVLQVTADAGSGAFTVTRAQLGTTAGQHASGASVTLLPNATTSSSGLAGSPLAFDASIGRLTVSAPAGPATYAAVLTAIDSRGAASVLRITVSVKAGLIATQQVVSSTFDKNTPITPYTPVAASGAGAGTLSYAVSPALPGGLSLNASNGQISGTPSAAATKDAYTITITETVDGVAVDSASATTWIEVKGALEASTLVTSKEVTLGRAVNYKAVSWGGGTSPYTVTLDKDLPAGLSFNNGTVSGTPTATSALTTYTVTVKDYDFPATAAVTASFQLQVNPAITASRGCAATSAMALQLTQNSAVGLPIEACPAFVQAQLTAGATGTVTLNAHGLAVGDPVRFLALTSGSGLSTNTTYFVKTVPTANTFTIAATAGGTALAISANGYARLASAVIDPSGNRVATPARVFAVGDVLRFATLGGASDPVGGVTPDTVYYVRSAGASFTIATTSGGSAVTISAQAAGQLRLFTAVGGTGALTYTAQLPNGLAIGSSTGFITGTPTGQNAATEYKVTVTDENGATKVFAKETKPTANGLWIAVAREIAFGGSGLQGVETTTGVEYSSAAVTIAYGNTTYYPLQLCGTYPAASIAAGTLPDCTVNEISASSPDPGITWDTSSKRVTVATTVAPGTYTVTLTSYDTRGASSSTTVPVKVNPAPTATIGHATVEFTQDQSASLHPYHVLLADLGPSADGPIPVTGDAATGTAISLTAPFLYQISPSLPAGLSFSSSTGQITGTPSATSASATYTVRVSDLRGAFVNKTITIAVNAAVQVNGKSSPATPLGVARTFTYSSTGGTGSVALSASGTGPGGSLPDGITFDPATGILSVADTAAEGLSAITITGTDANGATGSKAVTLNVSGSILALQQIDEVELTQDVLAPTLGDAHLPADLDFIPVLGDAAVGTITYAISPALPDGLVFDAATGEITGTPTVALAKTQFTVTVTDQGACDPAPCKSASATTFLTVNATPTLVGNATVIRATLGTAKTSAAYAVVGGTGAFTYSADAVLDATSTPVEAITFDATTRRFTIPDTVLQGTYTTTVRVSDSYGATASLAVSITVSSGFSANAVLGTSEASPVVLTATGSTNFTPVTPTGGTSPYSYSVSPALPSSLSINAASGQISGSASAARANAAYTVTITDDNGVTRTADFWLQVNSNLNALVRNATAYEFVVGETVGIPFTPVSLASTPGGTAPYTFSEQGGGLPNGFTLNPSTGEVTGTPEQNQNAKSTTLRVTDANGVSRDASFTVTVYAAVVLTGPTELNVTEGNAKTATFSATGGKGTKSYTVDSTTLPDGTYSVQVNPSNSAQWQLIVGATAPVGTYSATIRATDGLGVSKDLTVAIGVYPVPDVSTAVASVELTTQFSSGNSIQPVTVAPDTGAPPLTWSVSPALPSGLSIRSSDGVLTGTPNGESPLATYTVKATDVNTISDTATFQLKVNGPLLLSGPTSLAVTAGTAKSATFTGSGGTLTREMTIAYVGGSATDPGIDLTGISGAGPSGTVAVDGTVPVGTYSVRVTLTDPWGTKTRTLTITVYPVPDATTATASTTLTAGTAATPFTPVTVTGGAPALGFGVAPALPAGLTLSTSTGEITGTPTTDTNGLAVTHTVTVTDLNGVTDTATFDLKVLRVQPTLVVSNATVSNQLNTNPSLSVLTLTTTGGGGTGTVAYEVATGGTFCSVSGNVLTGLAAGSCTVVATKAGDDTYAGGAPSAAKSFTWTKAPQAALSLANGAGSVGTPLTLATTGGSGTGAVTYAVTASGGATCAVSGDQHSATLGATVAGGTCSVAATKATDAYYLATTTAAATFTWTAAPALLLSATTTSTGFTFSVTNYSSLFTYGVAMSAGSSTAGTASGTTRPYTVSGLVTGTCATATVTVSRTGYATRTAQVTGCTTAPALTLATPVKTASGFTTSTAFTAGYSYSASVTGGTGTATVGTITTVVPITVTGVTDGSATVTVTRTRVGYATSTASTTSTALPSLTSLVAGSTPARAGTVVTLTGNNLWGATAVSFGGSAATKVTVVDGQTVLATVPLLTTAKTNVAVTITTPGGTSSTVGAPTISIGASVRETLTFTSLSAVSGGRGTAVIITGNNLGGATSILARLSTATTGGTTLTMRPLSANQVLVAIPALTASTTKYVFAITTPAGSLVTPVASGGGFTVTSTAATPGAASVSVASTPMRGTLVLLNGTNIGAATAVTAQWLPPGSATWTTAAATTYTVLGTGQIRALIPIAAVPGSTVRFTVTTPGGSVQPTVVIA